MADFLDWTLSMLSKSSFQSMEGTVVMNGMLQALVSTLFLLTDECLYLRITFHCDSHLVELLIGNAQRSFCLLKSDMK